jgi:hypothetical protein
MNQFKLKEDGSLLTPEFIVSFPAVFEPSRINGKFGCGLMFPKETTDMKILEKAIETAAKENWGTNMPKKLSTPILDGDDSDREERAGMWYINAKGPNGGKFAPALIDRDKDDISDPEDFYPGCFARARITLFAYTHKETGNKGVSVGVRSIQKLKDGEPLVSRVKAEDDFEDLPSVEDDL